MSESDTPSGVLVVALAEETLKAAQVQHELILSQNETIAQLRRDIDTLTQENTVLRRFLKTKSGSDPELTAFLGANGRPRSSDSSSKKRNR